MKKITSNHFAVKRTTEGTNISVDFVPKVKSHTAPVIDETFINDEGNAIHILASGNQMSDVDYMKTWGQPKSAIKPKNYREPKF